MIIAVIAVDCVCAISGYYDVITCLTLNIIIAGTALDLIVAVTTIDFIVSVSGYYGVGTTFYIFTWVFEITTLIRDIAIYRVVAITGYNDIIACTAFYIVVAGSN
jgi:hypothetical protein